MNRLLHRLAEARVKAESAGLWRQRQRHSPALMDFSANDYLGLARDERLAEALAEGARRYGVGSGASPLVSGYSEAHAELEAALCAATGHEAALLFCSGFAANLALCHALFDSTDTLVADKLIHASMIDGILGSGANLKRYPHCDPSGAARLIERFPGTALLTESIFSMDGDLAPLLPLSNLCESHNSLFIVDDAHGFGVIGEQAMGASRLDGVNISLQLVTFGKALGCQGAAVLGSQALIESLVASARHYIYSTALSPAQAHAARVSLSLVQQGEKSATLAVNIRHFLNCAKEVGLALLPSQSPIQLMPVPTVQACLMAADTLKARGFLVGAIRPPTVPAPRLRITLSAAQSMNSIEALVNALADIEKGFGEGVNECVVKGSDKP